MQVVTRLPNSSRGISWVVRVVLSTILFYSPLRIPEPQMLRRPRPLLGAMLTAAYILGSRAYLASYFLAALLPWRVIYVMGSVWRYNGKLAEVEKVPAF